MESFKDERIYEKTVLIPAPGSRGDVQPFVIIGRALYKMYGYRVVLGVSHKYTAFVSQFEGLETYTMEPEPLELIRKAKLTEEGRHFFDLYAKKTQKDIAYGKKHFGWIIGSFFDATLDACNRFKPDLIVLTQFGQALSPAICEKLEIPFICCHLFPSAATCAFGPPELSKGVEGGFLGRMGLNRLLWYLYHKTIWKEFLLPSVNPRRKAMGLAEITTFTLPSKYIDRDKVPYLYLASPALVPRPTDWPSNHMIIGTCVVQQDDQFESIHDDVIGMIKRSQSEDMKLCYIGFGSMLATLQPEEQVKLMNICIEAVAAMKCLCILSTTHMEDISQLKVIKDILLHSEAIPHHLLLPHCHCVVHHGGAGTTQAVARAGVPMLVVPFGNFDQAWWGAMAKNKGIGLSPVMVDDLTVKGLVQMLGEILNNEKMCEAARVLGEEMRKEDGVPLFVQTVYQEMKKRIRGTLTHSKEKPSVRVKWWVWCIAVNVLVFAALIRFVALV